MAVYTTIDDPTIYFNTVLYTGNASSRSITGVGFQPDMVWTKSRGNSNNHNIYDSVRGATKRVFPNSSTEEVTTSTTLTSFDSDGFSLGGQDNVNADTITMASWSWKAGTSFSNDASATGVGTIDTSGSKNTTAGFSIITWTGTGSNGSVAHGLGVTPQMIMSKSTGHAENWAVYHQNSNSTPEDYYLALDADTGNQAHDSPVWNDTAPTSSVINIGTQDKINKSGSTHVAFCFNEVQGYSKFGGYTGNGNADGTFVYTGFRPAFLMIKNASTTDTYWTICDSKRDGFNDNNHRLFANADDAESTSNPWEMYSNGFKMTTTGSYVNTSGDNFIYMAFAEAPFVNSNGVPNNAR